MLDQSGFALTPALRNSYRQLRVASAEKAAWRFLPKTLEEIGPILRTDRVANKGEERAGAIRVFVRMPAGDQERQRILELCFYPLTGEIVWNHHTEKYTGKNFARRVAITSLMWPGCQWLLYTTLRVVELLGQDRHQESARLAKDVRDMLIHAPSGIGYPQLTRIEAQGLISRCKDSLHGKWGLAMHEGDWYAEGRSRAPTPRDPSGTLEFCIGAVEIDPKTGEWRFKGQGMFFVEIMHQGRGPASIKLAQKGRPRRIRGDTTSRKDVRRDARGLAHVWQGFLANHRSPWVFPLEGLMRVSFAAQLARFITPDFPTDSRDAVHWLLKDQRR